MHALVHALRRVFGGARKPEPHETTSGRASLSGARALGARHGRRSRAPRFAWLANIGISKEREAFMENLAMFLGSGMGVVDSLDSIKAELRSHRMRNAIEGIKEEIAAGSTIWKALEGVRLLPDYIISLIRVGEETGRLTENIKVVVLQQQKERFFRSRIQSAMMYPMLIMGLTGLIGTAIAWFLLPRLAKVFNELKLEMPFITKALIGVGTFLEKWGYIALPFAVGVVLLAIYFLFFHPRTKIVGQELLLRFPVIKRLIKEVELSRFGFILGTLLGVGIHILHALDSLHDATSVIRYKKVYRTLRENIAEGNSFHKTFEQNTSIKRYIPDTIQHLIVAAEQSGHLPETLRKIGETFGEKTETTVKNLTVLLEPILLIFVWSGVVLVALAVILPVYNLIGGLSASPEAGGGPPASAPVEQPVPPAPSEVQGSAETEEAAAAPRETPPPPEARGESTPVNAKRLEILDTELGYLRVRDAPAASATLIDQVNPGETYPYLEISEDWYRIELSDGRIGWVSGRYVRVIE
ncbi:MAG: type II secretion system F family protein [bacterium]|nr:type II secretion system F family protein [bacterium]MDZ4284478.1 type II secretion system F family protein [Patescibacteria group bacterium]